MDMDWNASRLRAFLPFWFPELWPVQLPPPHSLYERAPRCLYQWFSFLWATGKRHLRISSMQHLVKVKLSRRVQSEGWPRFREEQKKPHTSIHWSVLLSRAAASQTGEKSHSFTLRFYIKERVGCTIRRRHYKWPLFLSALALIVPF